MAILYRYSLKVKQLNINEIVRGLEADLARDRQSLEDIVAVAESRGNKALSAAEDARADALWTRITDNTARLDRARKVQAEENELDAGMRETHSTTGVRRSDGSSRPMTRL